MDEQSTSLLARKPPQCAPKRAPQHDPLPVGRAPQHKTHENGDTRDRVVAESIQTDADSVAGTSEFSSIPGDGWHGGNSTVDSEMSSMYNSRSRTVDAESAQNSEQNRGGRGGQLLAEQISLPQHPLQVSHKMPPNQQSARGGSRVLGGVVADTAYHQAGKIHADLINLGQASKGITSNQPSLC